MSESAPGRVRLVVNRDACCRSGACSLVAPDVFDQGDDGKVLLKDPTPPPHLRAAAEEAADYCPVSAIRLEPEPPG